MKLTVYFENGQTVHAVDSALETLVERAVCATLDHEGVTSDAEVSVLLEDYTG